MADVIRSLHQRAREVSAEILFPEGEDVRVLRAAEQIAFEGVAHPVIIEGETTRQLCSDEGISTGGIEFRSPSVSQSHVDYYSKLRDVDSSVARKMLADDLIFGALLLRIGEVDGLVAGVETPTAEVVAAANAIVGLSEEVNTASSYFLMVFDDERIGEDGALLFADCGVNIAPLVEQLADIAIATGETARRLLEWSPRIAMLSFSTKGSAEHDDAKRVSQAAELARDRMSDAIIDGELQADVALVEEVAEQKIPGGGLVVGDANVLIFPDLSSGNIAYKLTERLGGARALGPILQGYANPVSDLSRGATVEDIVDIAAITAIQAGQALPGNIEIIERGLIARRESGL